MLLTLRHVEKSYVTAEGALPVLRGISFDLAAGESLALVGESGCGKSTLLHLMAGLDQPDRGQINLVGQDITKLKDAARANLRRGTVGLVFQQFNLIPSLNVASNIAFHAQLSKRHDAAWSHAVIEKLGLGKR